MAAARRLARRIHPLWWLSGPPWRRRVRRARFVWNDECGMMNDELKAAFNSSFIIPHSSFLPAGVIIFTQFNPLPF
jgi:hypothetical protein